MFEDDEVRQTDFSKKITPISAEVENRVRRYVNPHYFNVDKIINYLNSHINIGIEIFEQALNEDDSSKMVQFTFLKCYETIDRSSFINRIPIYFYDLGEDRTSSMTDLFNGYYEDIMHKCGKSIRPSAVNIDYPEWFTFEKLYECLETVSTRYKVPFEKLFEYIRNQAGTARNYLVFQTWFKYISAVEVLTEENVFPDNLFYAYNKLLVEKNQDPIIYLPEKDFRGDYVAFKDEGYFCIRGFFPVDDNGNLVNKWIGIKVLNGEALTESEKQKAAENKLLLRLIGNKKALQCVVRIKINAETKIYVAKEEWVQSDDNPQRQYWECIYAAPKVMKLDCSVFRKLREAAGINPKTVSSETGMNLRTYQRIEAGETTPDGLNLLKLMEYFNIVSYDELIHKDIIDDPMFRKFRNNELV